MGICSARGKEGKGRGKGTVSLCRSANCCAFVAGAGLRASRMRFCWQAQHFVPLGVVWESLLVAPFRAVASHCRAVPGWGRDFSAVSCRCVRMRRRGALSLLRGANWPGAARDFVALCTNEFAAPVRRVVVDFVRGAAVLARVVR